MLVSQMASAKNCDPVWELTTGDKLHLASNDKVEPSWLREDKLLSSQEEPETLNYSTAFNVDTAVTNGIS